MKISIFLPIFNRRDELQRSLRALIPEKGDHEVFVVDLGSTDGSQDIAKEHEWVTLIASKEGLRSKAMNAAVDQSSGDILFFLEPGSMPERGWAQALEDHFSSGADAGHFTSREVDATAPWAATLKNWSMKIGHRVLGGPAGLNGVSISRKMFEKVSGFRPVPDFEWLAFAGRLKEAGATVKPLKHQVLISPSAGHHQKDTWAEFKEDMISAWKFRNMDHFDPTRHKRKASSAVIFGYDAFAKPDGNEYFQYAQQELQKITLEIIQSFRGVDKIYFIGGTQSSKLIGQPSGVEVIGKPRSTLQKRFSDLLERITAENQEGLLLVKSSSMELSHRKLLELSEGPGEEPCIILPQTDSTEWTALWFEDPALGAISDWELGPEISSIKTHLSSKIIRQEEEAPVKSLSTDSDARSLYYSGYLDRLPA